MTELRAVLFDLGNVVVDWEPLRLYRQRFDDLDEAKRFVSEVCNLAWHTEHDRGVPMDENAAPLIAKYPHYEGHIRAWRTEWLEMFHGYVPGVPGLIAALEEARVPLFGLSNLPAEKADETFDAFPMIRVLRDVVVSGVEKLVKPDPAIYRIALDRMDIAPEHVLFIDDRADNTAAARELGFQTHDFDGAAGLARKLQDCGLL